MRRRVRAGHVFHPGGGDHRRFCGDAEITVGEYDIAHLAYDIERKDLKNGRRQAGSVCRYFWGVNYMEFYSGDKVIVNPLRVKQQYLFELENNLLLYYTATSGNRQRSSRSKVRMS